MRKHPINLDQSPTFFVMMALEQSAQFQHNFLGQANVDQCIVRLTGGIDLDPAPAAGLRELEDALAGRVNGRIRKGIPRLSSYVLYGGTQHKRVSDPFGFLPGITEVPSAVEKYCPNARFIGVVAKSIRKMRYAMPYGLVVSREEKPKDLQVDHFDEKFTVIHPKARSILLIQKTVDQVSDSPWRDEAEQCFSICSQLHGAGYGTLLIAYNGGLVTESEVYRWAEAGLPVLLIKGSGRNADKLASNVEFLKAFSNVHVADNQSAAIRDKLIELRVLHL